MHNEPLIDIKRCVGVCLSKYVCTKTRITFIGWVASLFLLLPQATYGNKFKYCLSKCHHCFDIAKKQHNNICVGVCGINLHRPIIREYDLKLSESAEALILKSPRSNVSLLNS